MQHSAATHLHQIATPLVLTGVLCFGSFVGVVVEEARAQEPKCLTRSVVWGTNNIQAKVQEGRMEISRAGVSLDSHPLPAQTFLRGITYCNGLFVAVGGSYFDEPGVILVSRDGLKWTRRNKGNKVNLYGVASGPDLFIAVGERGTILSSTDGVRWKTEASGTSMLLASVAFGNGTFVAGGESGLILTSTNGNRWATHKLSSPVYVGAIVFSGGIFTVRSRGTHFVSRNGVDWQAGTSPCAAIPGLSSSSYRHLLEGIDDE